MATHGNLSSLPGAEFIEDLVWGGAWNKASGKVTYSFAPNDTTINSPLHAAEYGGTGNIFNYAWSSAEKAAISRALGDISKVANIKFKYVADFTTANKVYINTNEATLPGTLGVSDVPGSDAEAVFIDTIFNWQDSSWNHLKDGGYGYATIVHETLHSVGLAHPHDKGGKSGVFPGVSHDQDLGAKDLNQQIYTIMSYIDGDFTPGINTTEAFGYAAGPMAFDIAALQWIYGANKTTATGNNTYKLPTANKSGTHWECIWDAGGNDTISAGGTKRDATIDLHAATLKAGDPFAGGSQSSVNVVYGGYTIAKGVVIENAKGGRGDHDIYGNKAANKLFGNKGDDFIYGGGRNDQLHGGGHKDYLNGGSGKDKFWGDAGNDRIVGGGGSDTAIYAAKIGRFDIFKVGSKIKVIDTSGKFGTDTLSKVEKLKFGGKIYKVKKALAASNQKPVAATSNDDAANDPVVPAEVDFLFADTGVGDVLPDISLLAVDDMIFL